METIQDQSYQLIHHQSENKALLSKAGELITELNSVKDQLKLLAQTKWELLQEKARLEGQLKQLQKSFVT